MALIKTSLTYNLRQQMMRESAVVVNTTATICGPQVGVSSGAL